MPCPASACVHGEEEWGKDEPREKFRTAIADSGKPSMKAKPPHHSGNMKALFFLPLADGAAPTSAKISNIS